MRKTFLIDVGERTAATYVQAFCGLLLADATHLLSLGTLKAAAVAALPAALAVVKGALGGSVLGGGAAWLPVGPPAKQTPAAASPPSGGAPTGSGQ